MDHPERALDRALEAAARCAQQCSFTPTEITRLFEIAGPDSYAEIAKLNGISPLTVKKQASCLLKKAGLEPRAQARLILRDAVRLAGQGATDTQMDQFFSDHFS